MRNIRDEGSLSSVVVRAVVTRAQACGVYESSNMMFLAQLVMQLFQAGLVVLLMDLPELDPKRGKKGALG